MWKTNQATKLILIKAEFSEDNYAPLTAKWVVKHAYQNYNQLFIVLHWYNI